MKNNFKFTMEEFPNDNFEFENNIFSGKGTLKQNGINVEQSTEKGKPFMIKAHNGEIFKGFPKMSIPDISAQVLSINGKKYPLASKLKWYQYIIGGLPFIIAITGGAIGGLIGGAATFINYNLFRSNGSAPGKYLKVIVVNLVCFLLFLFVFGSLHKLFK